MVIAVERFPPVAISSADLPCLPFLPFLPLPFLPSPKTTSLLVVFAEPFISGSAISDLLSAFALSFALSFFRFLLKLAPILVAVS